MNKKNNETKIYWEKQGQDRLCGVNCLNSLLQGPYLNEIELANIAQELDKQEQALMGGTGYSQNFLNQQSNNVALDGNFSIQVLTEALKKMGNLYVESVDSKINQNQDLSNESGFICNSSSHWFAIRNIDGVWYNLNSTNRGGPEIISDFYLSAFLQSIKENGYSIFVVKGQYPSMPIEAFEHLNPNQKWFSKAQVQAVHQKRLKKKNYKLNIGGSDEKDYEEAIKRSLGKQEKEEDISDEDWEQYENPETWQPEKQPVQHFQGQGVKLSNDTKRVNYSKFDLNPNEDPELVMCIRVGIAEKFDKVPSEGWTIAFSLPDGRKLQWVFQPNTFVEDLYDYVLLNIPEGQSYSFILQTIFPKVILDDVNITLEAAGLEDMTQVIVSKQ